MGILHRGVPLQAVCSCDHLNTQRNSNGESKWEFSWSQEQTPATAIAILPLGYSIKHRKVSVMHKR